LPHHNEAADEDVNALAPPTDQRGYARNGVSDIGAFEFNGIAPLPPTVTTEPAVNVTSTSATLNANVNPNGPSTTFQFTSDFASFAQQNAGSGTANVPFSANVTGLNSNTQYHFNTNATNAGGTTQGVEQTFTTLPVPTPTPTATSAFGITNALADTTLQLRDVNGAIVRENDNWKTDQRAELENTPLQPTDDLEVALVETIQPGQYTAQVRGKNNATGIGVVQVYFLQ
jgi:hypothetical protein